MDLLERTWEATGQLVNGVMRGFERGITAMFGSSNARQIKRMQAKVEAINGLESRYQDMSNEELRQQTVKFRERLAAGETLDDLLVEAFAVCREAGRRFLGMRHYDVQMIGGMVLHSGAIAEMVTGEGKTLVATLPAYLNALEGKGVHVVTVNDYLARRDMEWMGPLYLGLGLTVGAIQSDMEVLDRQLAYDCNITYGTNNEFGFDYLRDNMRPAARGDDRFPKHFQQSQPELPFAIIDEVDNILIDEARTPLIISGPAHENVRKYAEADRIARQLQRDIHFIVNEKDHTAHLTDDGIRQAEKLAGVESFYTAGNMDWPHLIDNSLKAHFLYKRDVNYVVKEGRVVIVDEFTGRLMEGRQWSDGLHQSVEAKEGVRIKEETQTLATITLQNFFKLYRKLCGMTGTAMTEAAEFWKIYKLDVVAIPTNKHLKRDEHPDVIYRTEQEKFIAVADEIERFHRWDVLVLKDEEWWGEIKKETDDAIDFVPRDGGKRESVPKAKIVRIERKGRPTLVGTVSIEKSERLSALLGQRGVPHQVLNAKHHKREAEIVAQAGRLASVTIATNMAGRGTDIVLGGNPETMTWARLQDKYPTRLDVPREEWDALVKEIEDQEKMVEDGNYVKQLGGLHVIGTERHEARRIDLQLRGRCGRQGDPGSSRFFLSLEDDLMRIFAGPWVKTILDSLGMQEGERIESRMVTRRIEAAQKKVEERHFESRKNLLEYDEVMDEQRKRVYQYRQKIINGASCRDEIIKMIRQQVESQLSIFLNKDYGVESFTRWAGEQLTAQFESRDFRGMDFENAERYAKDEATRMAETHVVDAIEENIPQSEEEVEWNWEALAKFVNTRWKLSLRDRDLKQIGRDNLAEELIELARQAIHDTDLSSGADLLAPDYSRRTVSGWLKYKFGVDLHLEEMDALETDAIKKLAVERAEQAYDRKEAECPVVVGICRFTQGKGQQSQLDREALLNWARERFQSEIAADDVKEKQRDELRQLLFQYSKESQQRASQTMREACDRIGSAFGSAPPGQPLGTVAGVNGAVGSLADWLRVKLHYSLDTEELEQLDRDQLTQKVVSAVEDRFHPEMRRMERQLMLEIVDHAWKDHLLAMDYLRSSIGLAGYAQLDPKVEYKREGMRMFDQMWETIGERTTDYVFRIEQLDDSFVNSTFVETSARHDSAQSISDMSRENLDAANASQGEVTVETIRHRGERVGRNDPCPCSSGKKYKHCCMRKSGTA